MMLPPPMHSASPLMAPQILFQCHYCSAMLQVPLAYAGKSGPCPHCHQPLITPSPPPSPAPVTDPSPSLNPRANSAITYATDASALLSRSFSRQEKTSAFRGRGVMPDQSIHHEFEMKKEQRRDNRMIIWFVVVILFLAAATYVMKALVVGS